MWRSNQNLPSINIWLSFSFKGKYLPAVDIVAIWVNSKDKHWNVRHGADVNELLHGVENVSFINEKVENALNRIANGIHDQTDCEHFQWASIPNDSVGVRCPRPMEYWFEWEQMWPVEMKQLKINGVHYHLLVERCEGARQEYLQ